MSVQRRQPPVATTPPGHDPGASLALSRRLARVMDDLVTVPGTRIGIGLDALIGLVPGVGDLAGSTLSGVILFDAIRHRVPVGVLARMGFNLLLDAVLGLVPGVGDLLDVAHRANRKNLRLLERSLATHHDPRPPTPGYLLAAGVLAIVPLVAGIVMSVVAIVLLLRWIAG